MVPPSSPARLAIAAWEERLGEGESRGERLREDGERLKGELAAAEARAAALEMGTGGRREGRRRQEQREEEAKATAAQVLQLGTEAAQVEARRVEEEDVANRIRTELIAPAEQVGRISLLLS